MKIILLFFLTAAMAHAQQTIKVTFNVRANNIPDTSNVFITGNRPELGSWHPGLIPLTNISANQWERTFPFTAGEDLEFKITRGSWENEAVNSSGSIPPNIKVTAFSDTIINITVNAWKDEFTHYLKRQVTGHLDYFRNVKGQGVPPRDIIVWLPPGYDEDTVKSYPVLYMQDGQNLFDPSTSSFGTDWQLDETADSLIRMERMKPVIIVGLSNTPWRNSEYAENDTGYAYMKFVVGKVKPMIDSSYRTLVGPESTAVGGSSLGGLISFMLAWNYPDVFSMAMCVSPALKIYDINYVDNVNGYSGPSKHLKFYFDSGIKSIDSLLVPGVKEMIRALQAKGYETGKDILWYEDTLGEHNEGSWAARAWRPLLFFFGRK